jgi:hypothetical protein
MRARPERFDGFGPEHARICVGALIVTRIGRAARAEPALVGDHGVMPGGQARAQRLRFVRAGSGTEKQIRIHGHLSFLAAPVPAR